MAADEETVVGHGYEARARLTLRLVRDSDPDRLRLCLAVGLDNLPGGAHAEELGDHVADVIGPRVLIGLDDGELLAEATDDLARGEVISAVLWRAPMSHVGGAAL